jgi:hypothetical protein
MTDAVTNSAMRVSMWMTVRMWHQKPRPRRRSAAKARGFRESLSRVQRAASYSAQVPSASIST